MGLIHPTINYILSYPIAAKYHEIPIGEREE